MLNFSAMKKSIILTLLATLILSLSGSLAAAQTANVDPKVASTEKAEQIIKKAIEAVGGAAYLNVHTVIGRGFFTPFHDGVSQVPAKFIDYIVFPGKERTEFISNSIRTVQVNYGNEGWIFDGAVKTLNDQKPEQIEDFKFGFRTSVENILRGVWKGDGAKLSYIGRREAGLAKRNETVRLTYPDGFWIEYEFGAKDGFPAKILYLRKHKNGDTGDLEENPEADVLAKPIAIDGVTAPWIIDHFIAGKQTSRIVYESIEYNKPVADSLFIKPASVKAFK